MCERGPDSAGFAIYGGRRQRAREAHGARRGRRLLISKPCRGKLSDDGRRLPCRSTSTTRTASSPCRKRPSKRQRDAHRGLGDGIEVVGAGTRMEIYKEVGRPDAVAERFELADDGRHARASATPAWRPNSPSPPPAPIRSRPAATSASCTTARSPTTTRLRRDAGAPRPALPDRQRHARSPPAISPGACARATASSRRSKRSLDDLDGFYTFVVGTETASACCAIRSPASPPSWPRPTIGSPSAPSTARSSTCRASRRRGSGSREPATVYAWSRSADSRMPTASISARTYAARAQRSTSHACLRESTSATRAALARRSIRAGRTPSPSGSMRRVNVEIDGHVGYYCAGMNKQATVIDQRQCRRRRRREHDVGPRAREGRRVAVGRRHRLRRPAGRSTATPRRAAASR